MRYYKDLSKLFNDDLCKIIIRHNNEVKCEIDYPTAINHVKNLVEKIAEIRVMSEEDKQKIIATAINSYETEAPKPGTRFVTQDFLRYSNASDKICECLKSLDSCKAERDMKTLLLELDLMFEYFDVSAEEWADSAFLKDEIQKCYYRLVQEGVPNKVAFGRTMEEVILHYFIEVRE